MFKNSSTAVVSVDSVTGTGLSATMTDNAIVLPSNWSALPNNNSTMSTDTASSTATINSMTRAGGRSWHGRL